MHENQPHTSGGLQQTPFTGSARKAYHSPSLEDFGRVNDLTRTGANIAAGGNDGGTFPTTYNSTFP